MNGNDFMSWILRSPFHGALSNGMMLITVTGRKTGRRYTTPVGFYKKDEILWVLTSRDRTWWRNLRGGAEAGLLLKRKSLKAFAEPDLDEKSIEARLREYIRSFPRAAKPLGIRLEDGNPCAEDVARAARGRLFVCFKIMN